MFNHARAATMTRRFPCFTLLLLILAQADPANTADLKTFDDANLHAVAAIDEHEAWAVGDQGTVWHTMDGGSLWERQATGTRATLTAIRMHDFRIGWIAGRQSQLYNPDSSAILLATHDGGGRWNPSLLNGLPGLRSLHFAPDAADPSGEHGHWFTVGEASPRHPTGLFISTDPTKNWGGVRGPVSPGWTASLFSGTDRGIVGGFGGTLFAFDKGTFVPSKSDWLPGAAVRDLAGTLTENAGQPGRAWAVGEQCQVFSTTDGGRTWSRPELPIPPNWRSAIDFHAVSTVGNHVWAAGRPGTIVLHSADRGVTWEVQKTNQSMPINDLAFVNETRGWAIGDLGTILHTTDGGVSWKRQRPLSTNGETTVSPHAAILAFHQDAQRPSLGMVARLGGDEGWHVVDVAVTGPDANKDAPVAHSEGYRLLEATRAAGGASAERWSKFPLARVHRDGDAAAPLSHWNMLHENKAEEELRRDLIVAIRLWKPAVIVMDDAEGPAASATASMIARQVQQAFKEAGDPGVYPETNTLLDLPAHQPMKLFRQSAPTASGRAVTIGLTLDHDQFAERLGETYQDAADAALGVLADSFRLEEARTHFELVESAIPAAGGTSLTDGLAISPGTASRRPASTESLDTDQLAAMRKAAERKKNLLAMVSQGSLAPNSSTWLASLGDLRQLPNESTAARTVYQVGRQLADKGEWEAAAGAFDHCVTAYPQQPIAVEAYCWLIAYYASTEARLRAAKPLAKGDSRTVYLRTEGAAETNVNHSSGVSVYTPLQDERAWWGTAILLANRLRAVSMQAWLDPRVQLPVAACHRNLGHPEVAKVHYQGLTEQEPMSPWKNVVNMEAWVFDKNLAPPKALSWSVQVPNRPYLDGRINDPCWNNARAMILASGGHTTQPSTARGRTLHANAVDQDPLTTTVRICHDREFLYIAADCRDFDPAHRLAAAQRTDRDADMAGIDHVEFLLDPDRDFVTSYRLRIDRRGLVAEDAWGDRGWNPRWFVAVQQDDAGWCVEAAIPLAQLTDKPDIGTQTWAFNAVRRAPGEAARTWNGDAPANLADRPRLESLTHLRFVRSLNETRVPGMQAN